MKLLTTYMNQQWTFMELKPSFLQHIIVNHGFSTLTCFKPTFDVGHKPSIVAIIHTPIIIIIKKG